MSTVLFHCQQPLFILFLLSIITNSLTVTFPKSGNLETGRAQRYSRNEDDLRVCLISENPLMPCITSSMVQGIESVGVLNTIDFEDDLKLIQDPQHEQFTVTGDRREAHTLLEAITMYMEPRYLQWDLSDFYPGLMMTVGPTSRGYLQFFLDKRKVTDERSLSTGRLLVKRTVLPVLLGIKLHTASLAPILIAGIILMVKKILVFSKLSFILAAIGLYLNNRRPVSGGHHGSFGSATSGSFAGSGLGSFAGPKKHRVIIERPVDSWFGREEPDSSQSDQ